MTTHDLFRYSPLLTEQHLIVEYDAQQVAHIPPLEFASDAQSLGATAMSLIVWQSADGKLVVHPTGEMGGRFRKKKVVTLNSDALGDSGMLFEEFLRHTSDTLNFFIRYQDGIDIRAIAETVDSSDAAARSWVVSPSLDDLSTLIATRTPIRSAHYVRRDDLDTTAERHAAELRERSIDAVATPVDELNPGTVALYHRFHRFAFVLRAEYTRLTLAGLAMGADGVGSISAERLLEGVVQLDELPSFP